MIQANSLDTGYRPHLFIFNQHYIIIYKFWYIYSWHDMTDTAGISFQISQNPSEQFAIHPTGYT